MDSPLQRGRYESHGTSRQNLPLGLDPVPAEVKAERRKNVLLVIGKLFLKTVKWVFLIFATFLAAIFSLAFERNPRQTRG